MRVGLQTFGINQLKSWQLNNRSKPFERPFKDEFEKRVETVQAASSHVLFGNQKSWVGNAGYHIIGQPTNNAQYKELDDIRRRILDTVTISRPELKHGRLLDPLPTAYIMVPQEDLIRIAARSGFLSRFPHWVFGQEALSSFQDEHSGDTRSMELVTSTNPTKAYMNKRNSRAINAITMAHVFWHAHFSKHNNNFRYQNQQIERDMEALRSKVIDYQDNPVIQRSHKLQSGISENPVERFLELLFSINDLIDYEHDFTKSNMPELNYVHSGKVNVDDILPDHSKTPAIGNSLRTYLDIHKKRQAARQTEFDKQIIDSRKVPYKPTADILGFILSHSKSLEPWQKDIMGHFREEAYYFAPIALTRLVDEGGATWFENRVMLGEHDRHGKPVVLPGDATETLLSCSDFQSQYTHYGLGYFFLNNLYQKAAKGQLHLPSDEPKTFEQQRALHAAKSDDVIGLNALYDITDHHNDFSFLIKYLDHDFAEKIIRNFQLIKDDKGNIPKHIPESEVIDFRNDMLRQYENVGMPRLVVMDGDFEGKGELYIRHTNTNHGALRPDFAEKTLKILFELWGRPVHLQTLDKENPNQMVLYTCTSARKDAAISKKVLQEAGA